MGEKDISQKMLMAYNDVFADIINVLLFDGRCVIKEDELEKENRDSFIKIDGRLHEEERDISKLWRQNELIITFLGVENQTAVDNSMPLRVIAYDGAAYKGQLISRNSTHNKSKPFYPVVTVVLYFGKKRWQKPLSLLECIEIPKEFQPYVSDYRINVFEIAYLSDEKLAMFKSDFWFVEESTCEMKRL